MKGIVKILLLLLLVPFSGYAVDYIYYVSPSGAGDFSGSDPGNSMPGLFEATQEVRMNEDITGDDHVTFMILPGTYHTSDDSLLRWQGWDKPYVVFEGLGGIGAAGEYRPLISGLEREPLGPWTNLGGNVWAASWDHDFGWFGGELDDYVCGPSFNGWIGCQIENWVPNLGTNQWRDGHTMIRREYIVQNGKRFTQVTMPEFVDIMDQTFNTPLEGTGVIRINSTLDPNDHPVYAANAEYLLAIRDTRGVEVRNIDFAYGNPYIKGGLLDISTSETAIVENCTFHHSNADGLSIRRMPMRPENVNDPGSEFIYIDEADSPGWWEVKNCTASDNGFYGMLIAHSKGLLHDGNIIRHNNLRGYESGTMEYDTGGMKLFRCRNSEVRNVLAEYNYGAGIWFDLDGRDLTLRSSVLENNYYRGFYVERSPGPILLEYVTVQNNNQPIDTSMHRIRPSAIGISATDTMTVRSCTISDPYRYPVMLHSPDFLLEPGLFAPYGEEEYLQTANNKFEHCTIVRSDHDLQWMWFVVEAIMFRCYYMFHTDFNQVYFVSQGQDNHQWEAVAELVRFCPPIEYGNNYDLRDIYDSPYWEP